MVVKDSEAEFKFRTFGNQCSLTQDGTRVLALVEDSNLRSLQVIAYDVETSAVSLV